METIIIAAIADNGIIGSKGTMPWHIKEEFKHFKETTLGFPVVMGRKTFQSFEKPLKGRLNIIITRDKNYKADFEEVKVFYSINEAVDYCRETVKPEKLFIIGGSEIYKQALDFTDRLIISHLHKSYNGDTYFPPIEEKVWKIQTIDKREEFDIINYIRREERD
jgi:dihydrofolate reductase